MSNRMEPALAVVVVAAECTQSPESSRIQRITSAPPIRRATRFVFWRKPERGERKEKIRNGPNAQTNLALITLLCIATFGTLEIFADRSFEAPVGLSDGSLPGW